MAVDVDEADDADNDTTTEESSSNNTVDYAEVDPGPSDMLDMSSLPEESSLATSMVEDVTNAVNEDVSQVAESSCSHSAAVDIEAEGANLINQVLKSAVEEVNRRSQKTSAAPSCVDSQNSSVCLAIALNLTGFENIYFRKCPLIAHQNHRIKVMEIKPVPKRTGQGFLDPHVKQIGSKYKLSH